MCGKLRCERCYYVGVIAEPDETIDEAVDMQVVPDTNEANGQ